MLSLHQGGIISLAAAPLIHAAASSSPSSTDWVGYLLQGGPFAVILVLILADKLAPTGERNRLREENKQYKVDIQALNDKLLEVLPPLTEAAKTMTEVGEVVQELTHPTYNRPRQPERGGRN